VHDIIMQENLVRAFNYVPHLYIADGHHRNASASKTSSKLLDSFKGHDFYPAVIFPHNDLTVMSYNRVVSDLNGMDVLSFLSAVGHGWHVEKSNIREEPCSKFVFGMYLENTWYKLTPKSLPNLSNVIESLDVCVLQNQLLAPILGINDPRTDTRIDFVGGIRGLDELERRVNSKENSVAFALYPTSINELICVSDLGLCMPPKSTWFEPKLRSGLFVYVFGVLKKEFYMI